MNKKNYHLRLLKPKVFKSNLKEDEFSKLSAACIIVSSSEFRLLSSFSVESSEFWLISSCSVEDCRLKDD